MSITSSAIAYSCTTLAASMMNSVFQYYYVKLFLDDYRISNTWFYRAQLIYLVWNAINDPLFGYFQDSSKVAFGRRRRTAILYGAPLFALSFLIPWLPWSSFGNDEWIVGMHLIVSLCCYDGMFTYVVLAQCALFAEIANEEKDRQTVLKYSQIASILGSSAVLVTELVSNNVNLSYVRSRSVDYCSHLLQGNRAMSTEYLLPVVSLPPFSELKNFRYFQICCLIIATISYFAMTYTARHAINVCEVDRNKSAVINNDNDDNPLSDVNIISVFKQIVTNKNFVLFVAMNFLQIFHNTINSNFFSIFADHIIGSSLLPQARSVMAGSAFVLPQAIVLLLSPLLARYGSYRCILTSFFIKFFLAILMLICGPQNVTYLIVFMILDRSLPEATFSLFNLSVSDIIDDDRARHRRRAPISSMIFGTNALFTKPAQSLAPMFVVSVLTQYGYKHGSQATSGTNPALKLAMFNVMFSVPMVAALIQAMIWALYTLKGQRSKNSDMYGISV